jgi:hypothetical protein
MPVPVVVAFAFVCFVATHHKPAHDSASGGDAGHQNDEFNDTLHSDEAWIMNPNKSNFNGTLAA